MTVISKLMVALFLGWTISTSHAASSEDSLFHSMLLVDVKQLTNSEVERLKSLLDKSGPVTLTSLVSMEEVSVMPGSMTAEQGLEFVPDSQEAVETYMAMIKEGALPFSAIFLTTKAILSKMERDAAAQSKEL